MYSKFSFLTNFNLRQLSVLQIF